MIEETLFFMYLGWYLYTYGPPTVLLNWMVVFYRMYDSYFNWYNRMIYPEYWNDDDNDAERETQEEKAISQKYEDKYLAEMRKMSKEWSWLPEEITQLSLTLKDEYIASDLECIRELEREHKDLMAIDRYGEYAQLLPNKEEVDNDDSGKEEKDDEYEYVGNRDIIIAEQSKIAEERGARTTVLLKEIEEMRNEMKSHEYLARLQELAEQEAVHQMVRLRIENLVHSYVMENTPAGNVIMMYDKTRESFVYYADHNIPYRFLEVVGRKYVKMFNCRPLFVDMEEELKMFEAKWETEQAAKKKQREEKEKTVVVKKASVFAKFKSYNKSAGGNISVASVPNKSNSVQVKEHAKVLLKDKANRYTYIGKMANFSFLQKVEKKVFNQKLGFSYADFKKMKQK